MSYAGALHRDVEDRVVATSPALRVEVISDVDTFLDARPAWNRLVDEASVAHPFLTHDWIRSWWESFGAGRTLRILMVGDEHGLVGIAPLMITRTRIYGIPVRELRSITNDHTPRFDVIVSGEERSAVVDAIWRSLWDMRREWDVVTLCQIESESATLDRLARLSANPACRFGTSRSTDSPYLSIAPGGFTKYFATLPRNLRSNLKRRMRRLQEIGPVEFERLASDADIGAALADAFRIEAGSWKGDAGTAIARHPELVQFYSSVARHAFREGTLVLTFLRLNGRRIAFNLCLVYRQRLFKLKTGYLREYHACSPGQQLYLMTLRDAFECKLSEVDFLGSADAFKLSWTSTIRQHRWAHIFKNDWLGSLLYFAKLRVAPWARRRLLPRS